ncbi:MULTISPECIES: hypothetical protein, partial [unclassified Caballeronia]|uniref:hypothetical protein n=1 Tax=unclassified Caballeronia TaxID=2646786 RepID=UPI0020278A67
MLQIRTTVMRIHTRGRKKTRSSSELHPKSWTTVQRLGVFFMSKHSAQFKRAVVEDYLSGKYGGSGAV